ncbi:type 4a pilus biogenesis protein PilO [Patescibacteria group bacterium]|nr:type 4a pilus biogenesis protein PilO [Patescibacteria group bacterium]
MEYKPSIVPRVVSIVLFLIVISGVIFYVLPLADALERYNAENATQKVQLTELNEKLTELQTYEKTYKSVDASKLLAEVPEEINQSGLIEDFHKIAGANNIIYSSLSFGLQRSVDPGINAVTVHASFEGDYDDLQNFLKGLEVNGRKMIVKNIGVQLGETVEVEKIDSTTDEKVMELKKNAVFTLTIEAYYQ